MIEASGQGSVGGAAATGVTDAREWSATLAPALIQTLLGQRPVSQAIR
jgi:hypothetical protein